MFVLLLLKKPPHVHPASKTKLSSPLPLFRKGINCSHHKLFRIEFSWATYNLHTQTQSFLLFKEYLGQLIISITIFYYYIKKLAWEAKSFFVFGVILSPPSSCLASQSALSDTNPGCNRHQRYSFTQQLLWAFEHKSFSPHLMRLSARPTDIFLPAIHCM